MDLLRNLSGRGHISSAISSRFAADAAAGTVTGCYAASLAVLLPLALHHGYFDITETKLAVFLALTGLYLLALCALACFRRTRVPLFDAFRLRFDRADLFLSVFVVSGLVGAALSGSGHAFLAPDNRYQGVASLLLYAGMWFGVTRLLRPSRAQAVWALAAFGVVCLLGALQRCGLDPLALRADLQPLDRGRFLSTIGNIDFYGAYLCLVLPALPYLLCRAERRPARALLAALLLAGVFGALSAGGDGAAAALTASFLVTPLLLKNRPRETRRLLLLYLAMLLAAQIFAALAARSDSGYYFSHIARLLLRPAVSTALGALCIAGYLLLRLPNPLRVYRWYAAALLLAGALCALSVVLFSTVLSDVPLGPFARFLRLNADWGTDRGRIWRFCVETYRSFPLRMQIFGGGPGCLLLADSRAPIFSDALLDAAHCEYLQYLLTTGALGLFAYLGLLGSVLARALRRRTPACDAMLLALLACAIQSAVGIAQPGTTPLFFLLLAVMQRCTKTAGACAPAVETPVSVTSSTISGVPASVDSSDAPQEAL